MIALLQQLLLTVVLNGYTRDSVALARHSSVIDFAVQLILEYLRPG